MVRAEGVNGGQRHKVERERWRSGSESMDQRKIANLVKLGMALRGGDVKGLKKV